MKKTNVILLFAISILLFSCSSNSPSLSDAKSQFTKDLSSATKGHCTVSDFKKTNGQNLSRNGAEEYSIEFNATYEFKEDCMVGKSATNEWMRLHDVYLASETNNTDFYVLKTKGSKENFSGVMIFEKTENGWRFVRYN